MNGVLSRSDIGNSSSIARKGPGNPMLAHGVGFLVAVFLAVSPISEAQSGKKGWEAAERAAELIGTPVFAAGGAEVGEVADISFDDEGQPRALRMNAAAHLGLGTRTIEIPQGAFIVLRGAVVLELPAEAVQALPELVELSDEK